MTLNASLAIVCCAVLAPAPGFGQAPPTVFECTGPEGTNVPVAATPSFPPPDPGPLMFVWRDQANRVIGSGEGSASGSSPIELTLPLGRQTLTLTADNRRGRTATAEMVIEVRDTRAPRLTVTTSLIAAAPGFAGSVDELVRAAGLNLSDRCDPTPRVEASPVGPYQGGDTQVALTATDASGNSASTRVTVRIPRSVAVPPAGAAPADAAVPVPPDALRHGAEPDGAGVPGATDATGSGGMTPPGSGTSPVVQIPLATDSDGSGGLIIAGLVLSLLLVVGCVLLVGRARRAAYVAASLRAVSRKDLGVQRIPSEADVASKYEIRVKPRLDRGVQRLETDDSFVTQEVRS